MRFLSNSLHKTHNLFTVKIVSNKDIFGEVELDVLQNSELQVLLQWNLNFCL